MTKHSKPYNKTLTSTPSPQRQFSSLIDEICGIPVEQLLGMSKTEARYWLEKARFVCLCLEAGLKTNQYTKQKGEN